MKKRVFVGLSGGVDSAVSAALLKERGFDVTGVFIKIWRPEFTECLWQGDRLDAMRVAVHLDIPFCEIDLSDEYKKGIIDSLVKAYANGITPNPDVLCNREIKFGSFLRYAMAEGADCIATGHYARIEEDGGVFRLLRGVDTSKDQSYFLYMLGQDELSRALFPVGGIEKTKTRLLARKYDLPVAEKRDSQGLCFVGATTIPEFLSRFLPLSAGPVLEANGEIIGGHDGAALYTIGQRHGFHITKHGRTAPHYVVAIDAKKNSIMVSENRNDAARTSCSLIDLRFTSSTIELPFDACAQARYRAETVPVRILRNAAGNIEAQFQKPAILTPGQSLVVYRGEECVGGGIIK